jgi:multidrug efflux pump subunit AcrA (membrane-fusion protein)
MSTIIHRETTEESHSPAAAPPRANRSVSTAWQSLRHAIPTVAIIGILLALAVWGHNNDWTLPKFSTLIGNGEIKVADWCEEHGVPESKCVECNPDLIPKGPDHGWCAEHGVHNCPLHHPDIAQSKEPPVVTEADLARAARALAIRSRATNNSTCTFYRQRIQFASLDAVKQAGLEVELVERAPINEHVGGNGEITYDQTRLGNISSRAPGSIWYVAKNVGDKVQVGEVIAVVDAQVVGEAKSELVDALVQESLQRKTMERLQGLSAGVVAGRQVLEAEAGYETAVVRVLRAQQTLANLGLDVDLDQLRALSHEEQAESLRLLGLDRTVESAEGRPVTTTNLLPIRSPINGVVVKRNVVAGEVVDSAAVLFKIADTNQMWLTLNVPLEEAELLSLGQPVHFRPDGSEQEIQGKLSWISTATDRQTRMLEVRAELPNIDGSLRDETFGPGEVVLREEPEAIVVPNSAIHWEGCCHVVFVRNKHYFDSPESPKVFHVRSVRLGAKNDKYTEVIAGVLPGEVVATTGSDVLRAQLLKNSLGEGCTCGQ